MICEIKWNCMLGKEGRDGKRKGKGLLERVGREEEGLWERTPLPVYSQAGVVIVQGRGECI